MTVIQGHALDVMNSAISRRNVEQADPNAENVVRKGILKKDAEQLFTWTFQG